MDRSLLDDPSIPAETRCSLLILPRPDPFSEGYSVFLPYLDMWNRGIDSFLKIADEQINVCI